MAIIIDGKQLAKNITQELKKQVEQFVIKPKLAVIMVGKNKASEVYVRNKSRVCKEIGIDFEEFLLEETISQEQLLNLIEELNQREDMDGILLQSPIPKHLDINKAFGAISPEKDVDGFHPINVGKLALNQDCFVACTPYGVIRMLEAYSIKIEGANVVIIGRSNIVGKPLSQCLLNKNATVTICHSKTKNLEEITKRADIVISAVGISGLVTKEMIKEGTVVIDVGINRKEDGTLTGDVQFEEVKKKAAYITPVPGGVGPMTIAMLMNNVVKAAKNRKK